MQRRDFLASATLALVSTPRASVYSSASYLDALTSRLTRNELQIGGAPLAHIAWRHVQQLISMARSRDAALQSAASRLCRQSALILHDVREVERAEQVAKIALRFACNAGDSMAQIGAYDTLSLITAYFPGEKGAEYARRGLTVPDTLDGDQAILSARLARSLALTRERHEARVLLDQALDLAGKPDAEISGNVGIAFTDLGIPGRADAHLAKAIELTAGAPFLHSLYLARQVKTAIRARQPDAAAHMILSLATVAPMVDSPRLGFHLRHIMDGTQRWDTIPGIHHAREALSEAA
jgi:hypothetical protein